MLRPVYQHIDLPRLLPFLWLALAKDAQRSSQNKGVHRGSLVAFERESTYNLHILRDPPISGFVPWGWGSTVLGPRDPKRFSLCLSGMRQSNSWLVVQETKGSPACFGCSPFFLRSPFVCR